MLEIVKHIPLSSAYLDCIAAIFVVLGIISIIFALYLIWRNDKRNFHFAFTLVVFIVLGIGLGFLGYHYTVNVAIEHKAYDTFFNSFMSQKQNGNLDYSEGEGLTVLGSAKKQKIITLYADWHNDDKTKLPTDFATDKTELATLTLYPTKKKMVYKSKSKLGRAFMRVGNYIDKNDDHPANVVWKLTTYQVQCSYDTSSGHHKVICRVDNKKIENGKQATIIKY